MPWTDPMAAHSADLPSELTEVGAADRAADGGNPDSRHKYALKNRLLDFTSCLAKNGQLAMTISLHKPSQKILRRRVS
jgi:hypothetical protein